MLYENKCVFCDFLYKMAFFANYKKTRNFQKVHPSFYCSPWSPLSKKLGWICPQEMNTKTFPGPGLLVLKESVNFTEWHRDLKFGTWNLYMIINWVLKYFLIFGKELPVLWQKLKLLQRLACWKKLFPFEVDFLHGGLFGEYLPILWFVNESFDFFDLLMAIFSLLECFATFHKLPY